MADDPASPSLGLGESLADRILPVRRLNKSTDHSTRRGRKVSGQLQTPQLSDLADATQSPRGMIKRSPALPSSGPTYMYGSMHMSEIAQWLFCSHVRNSDAQLFDAAKFYWVETLWDAARNNELILSCVSLSMLLKKAALTGVADLRSYYTQKERIIQDLQVHLTQPLDDGKPSFLPLAIAMLAEFESRELQDQAASLIHVRALANLISIEQVSGITWRFAARADLRQALLSSRIPSLPYYIPPEYRRPITNDTKINEQATYLARQNCQSVPNTIVFAEDRSFEFFRNLHQMCLAWDDFFFNPIPPFGHIYNLAYRLRVTHAEAQGVSQNQSSDVVVELTLITIQLHVWILSRYWSVQRREVQVSMLMRAIGLLRSDLMVMWSTCADLSSLLWVLVTLAAAQFDMCAIDDPLIKSLLVSTCETLHITSPSDFEAELKRWPWLENWHPRRVELVWAAASRMLVRAKQVTEVSAPAAKLLEASQDAGENCKRWFLGGLEFYSSL